MYIGVLLVQVIGSSAFDGAAIVAERNYYSPLLCDATVSAEWHVLDCEYTKKIFFGSLDLKPVFLAGSFQIVH